MKTPLLIIFLLAGLNLFAQTEELEYKALKNKQQNGKLSTENFQSELLKWQKNLNKFGAYPNLPLNEAGEVHYSYMLSFENQPKQELFRHSLEWIALNFGLYGSQFYASETDGKIIYTNSFGTETRFDCNYTAVLTIRDNKLLVEFLRLSYDDFVPGHYAGENWINERTVHQPLETLYPVCLRESSEWLPTLGLFKVTNGRIKQLVEELSAYLQNYQANNDI